MKAFRVLFSDLHYVAMEKPAGFHSHPPENKSILLNPKWNALQISERQLNQKLFPCHRLDKATSGILLFAKSSEAAGRFQQSQLKSPWKKQYFALVRGMLEDSIVLSTPLKDENGIEKQAKTAIQPIYSWKMERSLAGRENRVFTLVHAIPHSGRFHQIRRHLSSVSLPILGDQRHGDKKLNRDFFSNFPSEMNLLDTPYMYLRFASASFIHPIEGQEISIVSNWPRQWHYLFEFMGFCAIRGNFFDF